MKDWRYVPVGENNWILDKHNHVPNPEDDIISYLDEKYHDEPPAIQVEGINLHSLVEKLPVRYQAIIWSYYFDGKPITQIGRENGYSKQYAHQELKKAIKLLQELAHVSG